MFKVCLYFKFLWDGSKGGLNEEGRVELSPRKGTMKQILAGRLLWLGGDF